MVSELKLLKNLTLQGDDFSDDDDSDEGIDDGSDEDDEETDDDEYKEAEEETPHERIGADVDDSEDSYE